MLSFFHSFIRSFIHPFIRSSIHPFIHSSIRLLLLLLENLLRLHKFPRQFPYRCVLIAAAKHPEIPKTISLQVRSWCRSHTSRNLQDKMLTSVLLLLVFKLQKFQEKLLTGVLLLLLFNKTNFPTGVLLLLLLNIQKFTRQFRYRCIAFCCC